MIECVRHCYFPKVWKVVVFLKSLDMVRSYPSSYRGISLLPVLGKVLELIMVFRLEDKINNKLCRWKFGFMEGRRVEHASMHLKKRVADSTSKYVLGIIVALKEPSIILNGMV